MPGWSAPGRTELAEAIVGLDRNVQGEVRIAGARVNDPNTELPGTRPQLRAGRPTCPWHFPRAAAPLDHQRLGAPRTLGRFFLRPGRERALSDRFVKQLDIRTSDRTQLSGQLSGGNQQKIVLSKTLAADPKVIILDEPTRGIDARARQDVYRIIRDLTGRGVAVLLISSELGEIADLSNRVLVMYRGRVEELSGRNIGLEQISAASFGLRREGAP